MNGEVYEEIRLYSLCELVDKRKSILRNTLQEDTLRWRNRTKFLLFCVHCEQQNGGSICKI